VNGKGPDLKWMDVFADPYLRTEGGRGVFLAGVTLGMVARGQARGTSIDAAPLFKQMNFGRMQMRDLRAHLGRIPELSRHYELQSPGRVEQLAALSGDLLLRGGESELGVNGNFAFAVAFLGAWNYFAQIFGIEVKAPQGEEAVGASDGTMSEPEETERQEA